MPRDLTQHFKTFGIPDAEFCDSVFCSKYMDESHEQKLITREHIAMHTNLIHQFKLPLYLSTLVILIFKSSMKLFKPKLLL